MPKHSERAKPKSVRASDGVTNGDAINFGKASGHTIKTNTSHSERAKPKSARASVNATSGGSA